MFSIPRFDGTRVADTAAPLIADTSGPNASVPSGLHSAGKTGSRRTQERRRKKQRVDGENKRRRTEEPSENQPAEVKNAEEAKEAAEDAAILSSLEAVRAALAPATPVAKVVEKREVVVDWTERYAVIDPQKRTAVDELEELHPKLRDALIKENFHTLFPVQSCVLPFLIKMVTEGWVDPLSKYACDVCVAAPTGQGKTLCYLAPMLHAIWDLNTAQTRGIVCVPTRDLALQVATVARKFSAHRKNFRVCLLVGASNYQTEQKHLRTKPDIVVCTPGRLVDHVADENRALDLSRLRWFVADEADRLLSQDYQRWLQTLALISRRGSVVPAENSARCTLAWPLGQPNGLPPLRKLLFSATMTKNPQKLAALQLERPFFFLASKTGAHAAPDSLQHEYATCVGPKVIRLLSFARLRKRVLVFCSSVETAHRLTRLMDIYYAIDGKDDNPVVREFSSVLQQWDRERILKRFQAGNIQCLICSDVAARGIDLPEVEAVVNYDVPTHLRTYVHRVGRTARAGRSGLCLTLLFRKEMFHFKEMIKKSDFGWERVKRSEESGLEDPGTYRRSLRLLHVCVNEEEEGLLDARAEVNVEYLQASYEKTRQDDDDDDECVDVDEKDGVGEAEVDDEGEAEEDDVCEAEEDCVDEAEEDCVGEAEVDDAGEDEDVNDEGEDVAGSTEEEADESDEERDNEEEEGSEEKEKEVPLVEAVETPAAAAITRRTLRDFLNFQR
eukprot:GEMP01023801.1.p1 GENE.GEMP01023801.1~~GEMP01023801.1.p1  ORF type:complete len:728 (+),score=208.86 GEMP01023801.1:84-2267(+)